MIGALAFAVLAGCRQGPEAVSNETNVAVAVEPRPASGLPLPQTNLEREQLLVEMMRAASYAVVGVAKQSGQPRLKGRRFEIRMRFGCPGEIDARRSWRFDERQEALRVSVTPDSFAPTDLQPKQAGPAADGGQAETDDRPEPTRGFLVDRPTQLVSGCAVEEFAAVPGTSALRFAIVPLAAPGGARARELLADYQIVKKIAPDSVPAQGLDLILRGRLDSAGNEPVIRCSPSGASVQCLATAVIDTVAIEDPARERLIAEWAAS